MNLESIIQNSYRNFHARGLDYLCLKRSPELTLKVYFFDGPESQLAQLPEIVMPHDHRYDFTTRVLDGSVANLVYDESDDRGKVYQKFAWDTPLNGGKGFSHIGETRLQQQSRTAYKKGESWYSSAKHIHTLRVLKRGSIIMLSQYDDVVPIGHPTWAYTRGEPKPPSLSGLYEEMSEADALSRIEQFKAAYPSFVWPS